VTGADAATPPGPPLQAGELFTTPGKRITAASAIAFCDLTGDPTDISDDGCAPAGLVLAYGMSLLGGAFDGVREVRKVREATVERPVRVGETIRVEGRVESTASLENEVTVVKCRSWLLDQHGLRTGRLAVEILLTRAPSPRTRGFDGVDLACLPL
jgi:acyl dehydratase